MKTTEHCAGCRNDFYNGNNSLGVKRCWSLDTAKLVTRIVIGIWQNPPYDTKDTRKVLNCYSPDGRVAVKPEALTKEGYWK
jgi:hypothetical protein